jgi:LysM repeat protein
MFFSAALLVLPFIAQSVFAADCVRSYTIKEGDICDRISAAKNVSTYQLAVINVGIIDSKCSNLVPNKSICLGYSGEDCTTTYVVQPDDSCDLISSKHGINSTILYFNNPQINEACTNIYVGEVLCVSKTVQVPPANPNFPPPAVSIPVTATAPHATTTPAPTPSSAPAAASPTTTPASNDNSNTNQDGEDDEDLPFCDEI